VGAEWGAKAATQIGCGRRPGAPRAAPAMGNTYQHATCVPWRGGAASGHPWGEIAARRCQNRQKVTQIESAALRPSPWHPEGIPRGWERVPGLHMRALTRWRGGRPPMGATSRLAHRQKVTHIGSPTLRPTCAAPEKWSGCVWWSYTTSVGVGCELGRAGWCLTTAALCALSLSLSPAHVSVKL
jgi:hypothetical protein